MILDSKDIHGVLPLGRGGNIFFALGGLYCGEAWWERVIWGEMLFLVFARNIQVLVVSIHLKENLPVVNINYLLMTCNFNGKLRYLL